MTGKQDSADQQPARIQQLASLLTDLRPDGDRQVAGSLASWLVSSGTTSDPDQRPVGNRKGMQLLADALKDLTGFIEKSRRLPAHERRAVELAVLAVLPQPNDPTEDARRSWGDGPLEPLVDIAKSLLVQTVEHRGKTGHAKANMRKLAAEEFTDDAADVYERWTGKPVTYQGRENRDGNRNCQEFIDFLKAAFEIREIKASAENQARELVARRNRMRKSSAPRHEKTPPSGEI